MKTKRLLLAFLLFCLLPLATWADIYQDPATGVRYSYTVGQATAKVDARNNVVGAIEIPSSFTVEGTTYTVTSISSNAFRECRSLTSITIPNSVTSIGDGAFAICTGLTSITIPNSVTSIGESAFYVCIGLTSITIPNSVTTIGSSAFQDCSGLTSITIPNSVTSIGRGAFSGCSAITSITVESGNSFYDSRGYCNAIIETANNKLIAGCCNTFIPNNVTSIGDFAFRYCRGLTSIIIPNSVTSIGDYAFSYCLSLTSITIPNSVTSIGGDAFYGCKGLTSITFSNSVTSIGDQAFADCGGLTEIHSYIENPFSTSFCWFGVDKSIPLYVPEGTKEKYQATDGWKDFKNIIEMGDAPTGNIDFADAEVKRICVENWDTNGDGELSYDEAAAVTDLGSGFKSNRKITQFEELQYFTGLTSIGDNAFLICSGLTSINIPNSVTSIGDFAFEGCEGLTSINIPNSVTSIGDEAFACCNGISSVTIPNSVTSFGVGPFAGCTGITSITVESGNSFYDSRDNCNAIINTATNELIAGCSNTIIPNSVTSIGYSAFDGCRGLTSITIPNGVTSIGEGAFYNCRSLTSITIPSSLTSIDESAFSWCYGLTEIHSDIENPFSLDNTCWEGVNKSIPLYVPKGTKAQYEATDGWKEFKNIVEFSDGSVIEYTLTYLVDGEEYATYIFNEGENIIPVFEPSKPGYWFSGWSEIPQTMPGHDVTVTGTFIKMIPIEGTRKWDFTKWSDATVANLKADAAASKLTGWSDVEKQAAAEAGEGPTDRSRDNCFWSTNYTYADGSLPANDVVIEELKGLVFNDPYTLRRSLAIAVNYQNTTNDYAGPSYLWLGGGKRQLPCFTIPAVAAGYTITMEVESHKISEARGIELYYGKTQDGLVDEATKIGDSFTPTTMERHTWTIENTCDVIVYNTNGCHIYSIVVAPPIEIIPGDITGTGVVEDEDVDAFIELYLDDEIPEPGDADFMRYDANSDGELTLADAVAIFYLSNGLNFDGTDPNATRMAMPMDNGQWIMDNYYEVMVEATELGNGIVRYTLTSDFEYAGFAVDVKGAQVVSESAEGMTLRSAETKGKHRIVAYNFGQAAAAGTVLTLDVLGEAQFSNINFSDANARNIRFSLGETTSIGAKLMDNGQLIIDNYYDLQGRASKSLKKGVNILRNGNGKAKKVSVK